MENFYIKYDYPVTGNSQLDEEMKGQLDDEVNQFLEEFHGEECCRIIFDCVEKKFEDCVTYIIYKTIDTNGAHPSTLVETFTYYHNRKLTIDMLFSLPILSNISNYVKKELLKRPDAISEMIEEGTKPNYANYRNFYFTENGIVFLFEQYQVAPYSSGIIEVVVPYSFLNS